MSINKQLITEDYYKDFYYFILLFFWKKQMSLCAIRFIQKIIELQDNKLELNDELNDDEKKK